jgi:hypothetical protein
LLLQIAVKPAQIRVAGTLPMILCCACQATGLSKTEISCSAPDVLFRIHSFLVLGIDALLCEVEVDVSSSGLEKTIIAADSISPACVAARSVMSDATWFLQARSL